MVCNATRVVNILRISFISTRYSYSVSTVYIQCITEALGSVRAGQGDVWKSKAKEAEEWKNR